MNYAGFNRVALAPAFASRQARREEFELSSVADAIEQLFFHNLQATPRTNPYFNFELSPSSSAG